jgi:sugar/nucleoside kinase (ribokinase family)
VIEVVSAGIIVADILAQPIDRYPEKGRLVLFDRLELHVGGCAANVANALGKLGRSAAVMRGGGGGWVWTPSGSTAWPR